MDPDQEGRADCRRRRPWEGWEEVQLRRREVVYRCGGTKCSYLAIQSSLGRWQELRRVWLGAAGKRSLQMRRVVWNY